MLNLLIYLFEVSVLTSIFYLFYRYLYFKLAYFKWSRYYFYGILIICLIIPILPSIMEGNIISLKIGNILGYSNHSGNNRIDYINVKNSFLHDQDSFLSTIPFVKIFFIIWISGLIRYLFIILRNITSVIRLKLRGTVKRDGLYKIITTKTNDKAFTFFKSIFVNNDFQNLNENEQNQILTHEKIHAAQLHTIDNIVFELYRAVFWFNPLSRLISANIKIIHEFIVDNKLTGNKNHPDYSRLILKLASHRSHAITVSSFSSDEIKNRIKLISFPESQDIRKRRFIMSIPVLIVTILASWVIVSGINIYAYDKDEIKSLFEIPFDKGSYRIISPFFKDMTPSEVYTGNENNIDLNSQVKISHKQTTYELKSYSNVYAIGDGIVSHIKEEDVFGLDEITIKIKLKTGHIIEYTGLHKVIVKEGVSVKRKDIIGITGDIRLYPSVDIKMRENDKLIDPEKFY